MLKLKKIAILRFFYLIKIIKICEKLLKINKISYVNCIEKVEKIKKNLLANANYNMCIDNLLLELWEELNEKHNRS